MAKKQSTRPPDRPVGNDDEDDRGSWHLRSGGSWSFAILLWIVGIGGMALFARDGVEVLWANARGIHGTVAVEKCAHTRSYAICYGPFESNDGSVRRRLELRTFSHDQPGRKEPTALVSKGYTHAWASDVKPAGQFIPVAPFAFLFLVQTIWMIVSLRARRRWKREKAQRAAARKAAASAARTAAAAETARARAEARQFNRLDSLTPTSPGLGGGPGAPTGFGAAALGSAGAGAAGAAHAAGFNAAGRAAATGLGAAGPAVHRTGPPPTRERAAGRPGGPPGSMPNGPSPGGPMPAGPVPGSVPVPGGRPAPGAGPIPGGSNAAGGPNPRDHIPAGRAPGSAGPAGPPRAYPPGPPAGTAPIPRQPGGYLPAPAAQPVPRGPQPPVHGAPAPPAYPPATQRPRPASSGTVYGGGGGDSGADQRPDDDEYHFDPRRLRFREAPGSDGRHRAGPVREQTDPAGWQDRQGTPRPPRETPDHG